MHTIIRNMTEGDRVEVGKMMEVFYASPAVLSNGSAEIFENDIENCVNECPYLEGYSGRLQEVLFFREKVV